MKMIKLNRFGADGFMIMKDRVMGGFSDLEPPRSVNSLEKFIFHFSRWIG